VTMSVYDCDNVRINPVTIFTSHEGMKGCYDNTPLFCDT
jgi:hypothetical protein